MNLSEQATRLALLRVLRDRIGDAYDAERQRLGGELDPADRKAAQMAGHKIGSVSKTLGRSSVRVSDMDALVAWVRDRYPTEIVETVRESYLSKLKDSAKRHGTAVDESTGEIVPGIQVAIGDPYITVRVDDTAADVIAAHWQDVVRYVPELPGTETGTDGTALGTDSAS